MAEFNIDDYLSAEEKAQIVEQRRKQWAADLFGHQLNAEATIAAGEEVPAQTTVAIESLKAALQSSDEKSATLKAEVEAKRAEGPPGLEKPK